MKTLGYIFLPLAIILSSVSCELETSGNGNLDGFWHIVSIDTLSTDGKTDLSQQLFFWSFQNHLMTLSDKKGIQANIVARFQRTDNTLRLYYPCIDQRESGDIAIEDVEILRPYGVNSIEEHFEIERLNKNNMTLKSQTLRLRFVKM